MKHKRSHFKHPILPYLFIGPQVIVTLVFFIWPALSAIKQSFFHGDAFGIHERFAWLSNYINIFKDDLYLHSLWVTIIFSVSLALTALLSALLMSMLANRVFCRPGR